MAKRRPTEAEFAKLKRIRREAMEHVIQASCDMLGIKRSETHVHAPNDKDCYCACPKGPCQHVWDGQDYVDEGMVSRTCSRCKMPAIYHDLRTAE